MITQFKLYEYGMFKFGENVNRFFFRPTNNSFSHGNLCYLMDAHSTWKPGYDYELKIVNMMYDKETFKPYIKFHKPWIKLQDLYYSHTTYSKLEFLTPDELFINHEKLFLELYEVIDQELKNNVSLYKSYQIVNNAMLSSDTFNVHLSAKKYNI